MKQKTIKKTCKISGLGVHTGLISTITLYPAPDNSGITIINKQVPGDVIQIGTIIPEIAPHATVIKRNNWVVSTIEHLMAAIFSLDLDNLIIEVDGLLTEVPILDGSAYPFIELLEKQGGLVEQSSDKTYIMPRCEIMIDDSQGRKIRLLPYLSDDYETRASLDVEYIADFEHALLGQQIFSGKLTGQFFKKELSPARTFGFLEQLPVLRKHRLALGSSLGNSVVMGPEGFLNKLRFNDEFVRHKVLDLVGDLRLLGKRLIGSVQACKTGHSFNRLVIEHYIQHPERWKTV